MAQQTELLGVIFQWNSSVCSCQANYIDGKQLYQPCDNEHLIWLQKVSAVELLKQVREAEKLVRRGIPNSFVHLFERYSKSNSTFHRPKEVIKDPKALSAEMGLYLLESLGLELASCTDPNKYALYQAGKATQGLNEKMWVADWENPETHSLFRPEEFFLSGDIDKVTCEKLFDRILDSSLLWMLARIEEECQSI